MPRNAVVPNCLPGGSSSGSAVAVSAGLVSFALGTDTAGSGRVPAAFNNIVGLKPTKGLVSTRGVVPACRSLDCVSIFALSCGEATAVLDCIGRFDAEDPFARQKPATPPVLPESVAATRFGIPAGDALNFFGDAEAAALFQQTLARLESMGAAIVEIDFSPFAEAASLLYAGPWIAERYAAVGDFLEDHPNSVWGVTRGLIGAGKDISAASLFAGQYRLAALARKACRVFDDIDVDWEDAFVFRAGGEYTWETGKSAFPIVPLRAGFGFQPIPTPDRDLDDNTSAASGMQFTGGFGIQWSQIHLDIAYAYVTLDRSVVSTAYGLHEKLPYLTVGQEEEAGLMFILPAKVVDHNSRVHDVRVSFTGYF